MLYPLQFLFDIIFPPTVHELTLRMATPARFTHWYQPHTVDGVMCLSHYRLPEIQAAIAACKFEHNYHAAKLLQVLVVQHLSLLDPVPTLLLPIPLSAKRERERLFNQVERVLTKLPDVHYPLTVNSSILQRITDTKPQTSLRRSERLTNLQTAFSISPHGIEVLKKYPRIIICDDVLTTGATLAAAKKVLAPHLSPTHDLQCLAWAH